MWPRPCSPWRLDLFYDYRTNVAAYAAWLRHRQPATLVIWGKYDPSFLIAETDAFKRDLPQAEIQILDAGHFATYEKPDEITRLTVDFLKRTLDGVAEGKDDDLKSPRTPEPTAGADVTGQKAPPMSALHRSSEAAK